MSNTLQQKAEKEYNDTAIDFTDPDTFLQEKYSFEDLKEEISYYQKKGNFKITLKKAGLFKVYNKNGIYKKYLRADIKIRNISEEQDYLQITDIALVGKDNNQYEGRPKDYSKKLIIHPGVEKETYLLIKGVQKSDIPKSELKFNISKNKYEFDMPE